MLFVIGRGSFGEVWLARSLTGSMRAIKVIRREDFDHGGTYEREFEGILNYEPISRQHPGLVDILQVGRNDERHYYYYVMELADHCPPPPPTEENEESSNEEPSTEKVKQAGPALLAWSNRGVPASKPQRIDPETYHPDMLSRRIREHGAAPNTEVVRHGAALARGIAFLHSHGLVHRDIKPGNVVFIDGKAKLADVGLVTTTGDGAFVGTEGYVSPEGPGTPAADIFSLGMVLYEMSTGKDRLDFPDLPSILPEGQERIVWRRVNRAICRAAARRPDARYRSGERLALALEGQATEPAGGLTGKKPLIAASLAILVAVTTTIMLTLLLNSDKEVASTGFPTPPPDPPTQVLLNPDSTSVDPPSTLPAPEAPQAQTFPTLEIQTSPPGADVYHGEQWLGTSPVFIDPAPSNAVSYNIRLEGHRIEQIDYLGANDDRQTVLRKLTRWRFPQKGMRWKNSLEMTFFPSGEGHLSNQPISAQAVTAYARETGYPLAGQAVDIGSTRGETRFVAAISASTAKAFCRWLTEHDQEEGILLPEQFYRPTTTLTDSAQVSAKEPLATSHEELLDIYNVEIDQIRYGSIALYTDPAGAAVYRDGKEIGTTPFELPRIRSGRVEFEIRMKNYKTAFHSLEINNEKLTELEVTLERGQGVDFESPWRNSLGMLFLPSSSGILVSAFETRRREFAHFVAKNRSMRTSPASLELATASIYPVSMVTRAEAEAFCRWLTQLERRRGIISRRHLYRLPSDGEWSSFAGLPPEKGRDPADRSDALRGFFIWGFEWPPPPGSGNFAGHDSIGIEGISEKSIIPEFKDGHARIAPVGSSAADPRGLYQVAGNMTEWVSDRFGGTDPDTSDHGLVRGGSWRSWSREELNASHRRPISAETRADNIGFRVILSLAD